MTDLIFGQDSGLLFYGVLKNSQWNIVISKFGLSVLNFCLAKWTVCFGSLDHIIACLDSVESINGSFLVRCKALFLTLLTLLMDTTSGIIVGIKYRQYKDKSENSSKYFLQHIFPMFLIIFLTMLLFFFPLNTKNTLWYVWY